MNRNLLAIFTGITTAAVVVQQVLAQPNIYAEARRSVVLIQNMAGERQGTGFIVSKNNNTYYVLTAGHVVRNGQFQIRTDSGETISVETTNLLPGADLALIQFTSNNQYPVARTANNASAISAPTTVYVLGYPAESSGDPEIPRGNITSRQSGNIVHSVETKAGMSGSPMLTENGDVIGIHIGSSTGTSFRLAIPIERYRELAPEIFLGNARENLRAGRFDQAIASIEQGRNLGTADNPEALVILAYAYFGQGNLDEAKRTAGRVNNNAEAALLLAAINYIQKNYSAAITNSNIANTLDSRTLGVYALAILGASHIRNNPSDTRSANINTSTAISQLPNDPFVNLARSCSRYYSNEGDIEGARTFFNNAVRFSNQIPANLFLGVISARLQEATRECFPPDFSITSPRPRSSGERYKFKESISLDKGATNLNVGATALAVSFDSRLVAVGLRDGSVSIYDLQSRNKVTSLPSGQINTIISSVAFTPDGREIAIAAANGKVKVFNIQTSAEKYTRDVGNIPRVVFSNNGRALFVSSGSGTLRILDNRNGQDLAYEVNTHNNGISSLALSPDGRFLATGGGDGVVKLWGASDLLPVNTYPANQGSIDVLAFTADGSQTISADFDVVRTCSLQTQQCDDVARSSQVIRGLAVSPTNGHVAYSADDKIFLEDQRNKQSLGSLSDHRDNVNALTYTPDGKFLISGSDDKTIIIWEVQ